MKKSLFIVLIVFLIMGCVGPAGEAYVGYYWIQAPLYLYDENPSIPGTVYNGDYYHTSPGIYYLEYTAWNAVDYWTYYKIEEDDGFLFIFSG